MLNVVTVCLWG